MRTCKYPGCKETEELEQHHIVPKMCYEVKDHKRKKYDLFQERNNRVTLCKKHHSIIQGYTYKLIWKYQSEEQKEMSKVWIYDKITTILKL